MRIPNIYTPSPLTPSSSFDLDADAANHVVKVLRMRPGDALRLFNGDGYFYAAEILATGKKTASVRIDEKQPSGTESTLHTHLGQVISRGDRMDYAIQKATELGVSEITPLFSERCEVRLNEERREKRRQHWQQVAIHAAEQCGRACVPGIHAPCSVADWLAGKADQGLALVLHHRDTQTLASMEPPEHVSLLIGPEGGLSNEEIEQARAQGFKACTFGPRVMRTETAPVVALGVMQWLWGDF